MILVILIMFGVGFCWGFKLGNRFLTPHALVSKIKTWFTNL
jgi:hypothetical protein